MDKRHDHVVQVCIRFLMDWSSGKCCRDNPEVVEAKDAWWKGEEEKEMHFGELRLLLYEMLFLIAIER